MASYAGYASQGYGAQGGEDGGGFMTSSQQGSQGATKSKYAEDTLRPVTIKQILDCKEPYPGGDLTLDGAPISQVTFVGQVRSVNAQTTNITYTVDDGTGMIDVKKWIDADRINDEMNSNNHIVPDTYVRIFGRLTTYNNRKHIGAHCVRIIRDFNEVNYHLLEATYVHLLLTKGGPQRPGQTGAATVGGIGGDSMFVDQGFNSDVQAKLAACSPAARTVFNFLADNPMGGNEGVHVNLIASNTRLSYRDALDAGNELLSHGLIYCTMDDETWAVMEC